MTRGGEKDHSAISRFVDTGVTHFGRLAVQDVEGSDGASWLVKPAYEEANNRSKYREAAPHELVLADGTDPLEAVRWLGKPIVSEYGNDFVMVDSSVSSLSNRATDMALEDLRSYKSIGFMGFAFFLDRRDVDPYQGSQRERIERLREGLHNLAVPTLSLVVMSVDSIEQKPTSTDVPTTEEG